MFRDSVFLASVGAIDTTPRDLHKNDEIEVLCYVCKNNKSLQRVTILKNKISRDGLPWRCMHCGLKSSSEKRSTGVGEAGTSRKAAAMRSESLLKHIKALDITPRVIRNDEYIEVHCWDCDAVGAARLGNQKERIRAKGHAWRCKNCVKKLQSKNASERTGDKNGFHGKKHTKETKEVLSEKTSARMAEIDIGLKKDWSEKARAAAYEKYDGNPMHNPEVAQAHHESTHTEEFIERVTQLGIEKSQQPDFAKKMAEYSNIFWTSESGSEQKLLNKQRVIDSFNTVGGKFYDLRLNGHALVWSNPIKKAAILDKIVKTNLDKFGFPNAMKNPEVRRKALTKKGMTAPEKYVFEMLLMRGYDFKYNEVINGKCWDFVVYIDSKPELIIEVDGEFNHGLINDPFFSTVGGHNDPTRFSLVPNGCRYLEVDGKRVKDSIPVISYLLGADYVSWLEEMFTECINSPFPYPKYEEKRMLNDWHNLCRTFTSGEYNDKIMPANSIVTTFHPSIYHSRRGNKPSPVEAWQDPYLLLECIQNRFVYRPILSTQQMARGFERNNLAPRVSVFQPSLARYLVVKFAPDAKTCIDTFSGFSGRMLGAASLGLSYTGYDINSNTVKESRDIIDFLGLDNCSVIQTSIEELADSNEYDVLLTCPPYGDKEVWSANQKCELADYYVKMTLEKIKAKVYIFVVDETKLYSDNIVEYIGRKSHMASSAEKVLIFR